VEEATRATIQRYWDERLSQKPADKPKRELAPCGSVSAYKRHLAERKRARMRGEREPEIDQACKDAWAERWNEYATAGAERTYLYGRGGSSTSA
jgi:hypothetical protein